MPRQRPSAVRATPEQLRQVKVTIAKLEMLGMTRTQIAQAAGLHGSTITRLAAGKFRAPSRTTVQAVLAVRPR
jgi:hypothetical protein